MAQRELLGQFEQMVLLAAARVGDEAHGMAIHDEILRAAGRDVSIPALYVTLSRLEKKGMVAAEVVPDPEGGRSRKCYKLEPSGAEALTRSKAMLDDLWDGVRLRGDSR